MGWWEPSANGPTDYMVNSAGKDSARWWCPLWRNWLSFPEPTNQADGGFAGEYILAGAHMDFSFTSQVSATDKTPFSFTSNPDGQRVLFAEVGHEMNGMYLH